ncbi:MAG TPA: hypothetical protein PLL33_14495 [Paracoccus sp. (in: a-proteobacteria)]|nr:hypothetical protein [Paracoccus sp. (in: a-proteobacteria)]
MVAAALCLAATAALADPGIVRVRSPNGEVYADARGMTLYVFDKDSPGKSTCEGSCAANWPPLVAPAGSAAAGPFAPIQRSDGTMQWAMNGRPLYLWAKDAKPGDVTGDGVGGVWHAAR